MNIEKKFKKNGYDMTISEENELLVDYHSVDSFSEYLEEAECGHDFMELLVDDIEEYLDYDINDFRLDIYNCETDDGNDCMGGVVYYNGIPLLMSANSD